MAKVKHTTTEGLVREEAVKILRPKDEAHSLKRSFPWEDQQGERCRALFQEFKDATDLPCAVVAWNGEDAARLPRWWSSCGAHQNDFCYLARNLDRRSSYDCMECDMAAAELARSVKTPVFYRCHRGINEIAVPVISEDGRCSFVFITGQLQPPGTFWFSEEQRKKRVHSLDLYDLASRLLKRVQRTERGIAGPNALDRAELLFQEYAKKMTQFSALVAGAIANFLKATLLPFLAEEARKRGNAPKYRIDFDAFAELTSRRLRIESDRLMEPSRHLVFAEEEGVPTSRFYAAYHGLAQFGNSPSLLVVSSRTGLSVPRTLLLQRESMSEVEKRWWDRYIAGADGEKVGSKIMAACKATRPAAAELSRIMYGSVVTGRAPREEQSYNCLQMVELEPSPTVGNEEITEDTMYQIANSVYNHVSAILHEEVTEDRSCALLRELHGGKLSERDIRAALRQMLTGPLPSKEEMRFIPVLQTMLRRHEVSRRRAILEEYMRGLDGSSAGPQDGGEG